MKKSLEILLFSFVVSATFLISGKTQITITSGDLFNFIGTQKTMETDSIGSVSVNVGSAGANQNWDFTQNILQAYIETWDFLNPVSTPYASDFPTANIALRVSSTDYTDTTYSFFRIENSSFTEVGQVLFFQDTTIVSQKSLLVLPLPCTMGANWMTRDSMEFGFGGSRIVEIDIQDNTIDAWGTVNVPSGQFNCLRIREDDVFISNTYVNDILVFSDTTRTINYTWITKEVIVAAQAESQENDTNPNFTNAMTFTRNIRNSTRITEVPGTISENFRLEANYPNPFNPVTTIKFELPVSHKVVLKVYNTLGQLVETLLDQPLAAGPHEVQWKPVNKASGLYFYILEAGEYRSVKKMILMK